MQTVKELMEQGDIHAEIEDSLLTAGLQRVRFYRQDNHLVLTLHTKCVPHVDDYVSLTETLREKTGSKKVTLQIQADDSTVTSESLHGYLNYYFEHHSSVVSKFVFVFHDNKMVFQCPGEKEAVICRDESEGIKTFLKTVGFSSIEITHQIIQPTLPTIKDIQAKPIQHTKPSEKKIEKKKKYFRVKKENYLQVLLKDIETPVDNIQFEAEVFNLEEKETKQGTLIQTFRLYDGTDAIIAKRFEGRGLEREEMQSLKNGMQVHVYGKIEEDKFMNDLAMLVNELEVIEKKDEEVFDDSPVKRMEWHTHTQMSEMDGVCAAADIVAYAHKIGLSGVAITDHADVQALKKAYDALSAIRKKGDQDFKVGFGCEMNMADDHLTIVRNSVESPLDNQIYVAFDLETTGLSCFYDDIIEFGAVRIQNFQIIDRLQMFIKPTKQIPGYIVNKTGITNAMVANAKPFGEAIHEILDYIQDYPIIAHNATFDYYFLNEELRRIDMPPLKNCVIDTLDMSRAILRDKHVYRLGNICHHYKVTYDEEDAHRADYDAEALANVFFRLLNDAKQKGCSTISDLQTVLQSDRDYEKVRKYHICVIAKDNEGIKDLYRLVSESNISTLAVGAKSSKEGEGNAAMACIKRSSLASLREHLLFGTACYNSKVFELACNGDDTRLKEEISFYDYVEIQPLENFTVFLAKKEVPSKDRLKDVIKRIIRIAQELNKPIIATSDAHYCHPRQKLFRDIYIMNQGVGGSVHPLYIRDDTLRQNTPTPHQHIRTTKEMKDAFAFLEDEALIEKIVVENTNVLKDMLEDVRPVPSGTFPPTIEGSDDKLRKICWDTCMDTYGYQGEIPLHVKERLEMELDNIIKNGYGVHYYIAHLLVKKSNDDGYVVGSRGSVGSSFTATMAKITEVNPLEPHYICPSCRYSEWIEDEECASGFDLEDKVCPHCGAVMHGEGHRIPFQTFLGFHADKVPDIDLNFSGEYQWRAHAFIREIFGENHAFRAGTIGTVAEKTALGYVNVYCEKMHIPNMRRAMKEYLAAHCRDVKRTTGQHAGGIIIIPEDHIVEDFTPIQYPANDPEAMWMTTHYDFHDIHDNVLKFDILGHVDPTAIRLLQDIADRKPLTLPFNDPETISLFSSDEALHCESYFRQDTGAVGLPEFGTAITRRVLAETKPTKFSDLIIISGLTHGTDVWAGNAQTLIESGHTLHEVIGCRDDIMNYLLAKELPPLSAFNIMEHVRKGKGLTADEEKEMKDHDVPEWYITSCKKIKYMFPRAHAVAYCMMAVRLGWYKVHEPHNFYIQYLTLRCDAFEIETMVKGFDAIKKRMDGIQARRNDRENPVTNKEKALCEGFEVMLEMYARGYKITNISLEYSLAERFTVRKDDPHNLIPPFIVLDGLGENVAKSIVEARDDHPFISIEDLMRRTGLSKTHIDKLKKLGVLDHLTETNQLTLF